MTDLGEMSYFLAMEIQQSNGENFIGQQKIWKGSFKEVQNEKLQTCKHSFNAK